MLFFHNLNQSEDAGTELYFRTSTGTAQNDASILVDCPSEGFTRFVFSNEVDGELEERFIIYEQTLYSKGRYFILKPPGNHSAQINFVDLDHGLLKYEQDNDALTIKSLPAGGSVVLSTDSYFVKLDDNGALVDPSDKHFRADVLNVKFFGATGDGITDDTSAIQDALDTAGESSIVWFPAGEYLISSPLNVSYGNQKILGESRSGAILIADGAFAGQGEGMIEIDSGIDVIEIGNLYFKCGNYADYGIYGPGVSSPQNDWYLHDLTIRTPATCGIKASNYVASYERIRVSEGNGFYLGAVDGGYEGTNITLRQCFVVQDDLVNSYTAYQFKQVQGWTMIGCASDKSNLYLKIEDGGYGIMLGCDGESNRALLDQTGTNANTTLKNCRIWVLGDTVTPATNLLFYRGILSIENSDIDVVAGGFTYLFAEDSQTDGLSLTNNTHDFLADPVTYPVNLYAGAYHLTNYSDLNDPNFLTSDFTKTAIDALEVDAGTLDDHDSTYFATDSLTCHLAGDETITGKKTVRNDIVIETVNGTAAKVLYFDNKTTGVYDFKMYAPNDNSGFTIEALKTNAKLIFNNDGDTLTIAGNTVWNAGNFGKTQIDALGINASSVGNVFVYSGSGSPEGVVTAATGSLYTSTAGGSNTTLYVKESGSGNTGWVAK
jgi:hypothetical protein